VNAICLIVGGIIEATLPATEMSLQWQHSVEKTRWEERYRIDGSRLALVEARVQGMGAGMEPPDTAQLRNGWWIWQPAMAPLAELKLTRSSYARDYDICWAGKCAPLSRLLPTRDESVVVVRACNVPPQGP